MDHDRPGFNERGSEARDRGVRAIIWDYDGTLVDTRLKNLNVNRAILEAVTGRPADDFAALRSVEALDAIDSRVPNWRDLYTIGFGLTETQADEIGRLWSPYQLQNKTPTPLIVGIPGVLAAFKGIPQGIVSQNGRAVILETLAQAGVAEYFRCVVGYQEVASKRQKPAPDGLIYCLEELTNLEPGIIFYIGDFETDAQCAIQANAAFKRRRLAIEVVMIGAFYGYPSAGSGWTIQPDHIARRPADVVSIVGRYR